MNDETENNSRGYYGQLNHTPDWVQALCAELNGTSWTVGIETDRRGRGTAVNVDAYSYDTVRRLAVVQVRQCTMNKYGKSVLKDYYMIGRNENGNAFAHPIDSVARSPKTRSSVSAGVTIALCKIWDCDPDDLDHIVRNGDVAFVPCGKIPATAERVEANGVHIRESHFVQAMPGAELYRLGNTYYVRGRAKIEHEKHQHPTIRARGGIWRVQPGVRANTWGFSAPTAD